MNSTTKTRTLADHLTVPEELHDFIDRARELMADANGAKDQRHAFQMPGRLYYDANQMLVNLLTYAYGKSGGEKVFEGMLDSGEDAAYVANHLARVEAQAEDSAFEEVAELYDDATANVLRENYPSALVLVAGGWTMDSALDHVQGSCDRAICTGDHEDDQ